MHGAEGVKGYPFPAADHLVLQKIASRLFILAEEAETRAHKALVILRAKDSQVIQLQKRMEVLEKIASKLEEVMVPPLNLPPSPQSSEEEEVCYPRGHAVVESSQRNKGPIMRMIQVKHQQLSYQGQQCPMTRPSDKNSGRHGALLSLANTTMANKKMTDGVFIRRIKVEIQGGECETRVGPAQGPGALDRINRVYEPVRYLPSIYVCAAHRMGQSQSYGPHSIPSVGRLTTSYSLNPLALALARFCSSTPRKSTRTLDRCPCRPRV
ncbi:hypothetical protein J6590_068602 [Homalodisca vitripennis]|nr:hypothetical protein J6590_068602 [Homalodisca vitripennis]